MGQSQVKDSLCLYQFITYSTDLSHQHFQGFWYYEYFVEHPGDVVKSLEKRGFIQPGNLRSAIQNQTVLVIKNELRASRQ